MKLLESENHLEKPRIGELWQLKEEHGTFFRKLLNEWPYFPSKPPIIVMVTHIQKDEPIPAPYFWISFLAKEMVLENNFTLKGWHRSFVKVEREGLSK